MTNKEKEQYRAPLAEVVEMPTSNPYLLSGSMSIDDAPLDNWGEY